MSTETAALPATRTWDAPKYDPWLLAIVLTLVSFGIVMVYSSSAVFAASRMGDGMYFLKRQAFFAVAGLAVLIGTMKIGYRRLEALALPMLIVCFVLIGMTLIPGVGIRAGGAQRWVNLGVFNLQPSEIAKVALCVYLAKSVAEKGEDIKDFKVGWLPHLLIVGVFGGVVLAQPDFGSLVVMVTVTMLVLFVAGARVTYMLVAVAAILPIGYLLVVTSEYRMRRIEAFLNPFENRFGSGYQVAEALMSIGSGGLTGLGLGDGRQKLGYLPAGHTDYILASIGEELGLVGVAFTMALFAALIWRGLKASLDAADPFGAYLAFAITALFAVEVPINAGMCLGMLPPKGIALPFLSYGGTQLVKVMWASGLLLSVSNGGGGFLRRSAGAVRCN